MKPHFSPLFSIVIPSYNSLPYVMEAVQSAFDQTYENIEVVVDDNISRDGTPEKLRERFGANPRFRLFANKENLNIPHGWNRGMARALGDYVVLLHSDNLLHPRYVELMVESLTKYGADLGYAECHYFNGETPRDLFAGEIEPGKLPHAFLSAGSRAVDYIFRFQRMIPTSVVAISRKALRDRMPFDPTYLWDPDIELMSWLARRFDVVHLSVPLGAIRTHGGQAASWKDPTFSEQYEKLLRLANTESGAEKHHFLIHWAWSNQDVCERLSAVKGAPFKTYVKYQLSWLNAELKLFGYFSWYFARKVRLMGRYFWQRLTQNFQAGFGLIPNRGLSDRIR